MHNHAESDYVCPICQIIRREPTEKGDQSGSIIFQDNILTAFIAGKWWKSNLGHVIIVPNAHIENIYDMSEDVGHKIFNFSKKIALALKETYQCDGVSTRQHNEPAGNQDAFHFHLHVFPRYTGDNLYINHKDTFWPSEEEKRPYVDKIKNYLSKNS